ncbi:MAG: serine hydroxymethyltransferase [Legionellales bacterium RIFCSPHIGHO2_12_FULL_37_14]|nr:MAG: serine hydroxymethyltransferase [Legionellales bacterium RIFCSPHIGHO2_12_FULL_37_14]
MFPFFNQDLSTADPDLYKAIELEINRQNKHIELIASENYTSLRVMQVQGSVLTNKYAEGYPNKRYYGGCEYVDMAESLAIERAKKLFKAHYVNVQPHSGASANAAVMLALLRPGDTILGMALPHGGHLTHGSKANFSGKLYNAVSYGVDLATGLVDYAEVLRLAELYHPRLIVAGFSAYSRSLDWQRFREIADKVGAYLLVDMAHIAGLIAADLIPSPILYADVVTTTTHKTLRGPRGGMILAKENAEIARKLNSAVFPGLQGGPLMHVIAAKAVAFHEALQPEFKAYQKQVMQNAKFLAHSLQERGLNIVSGGTDNHLMLLDLRSKKLTGKEADVALHSAQITVNKNTVPNDPESAFVTSGLRLGTPAVTTRGMREKEMGIIANWIADLLENINDTSLIQKIAGEVSQLCTNFPIYK